MLLVFLDIIRRKNKNPLQFVKGFMFLSKSISRILYSKSPYHLSEFTVTSKL